ncbi:hypothetical protein [Symbioplanes lichenis]|uniref:hypothetical protein n=1 Tax=Symbioplanes lichenis TaxID=1629072 RepID=UPI0027397DA1|nr:hypothetical protein [Actinoplanes lichenis]
MNKQPGELSPISDGLHPARRKLAEALRAVFGTLPVSVRKYAASQGLTASNVTRYLKGDVLPPETFIADLLHEAGGRPEAAAELNELYRAAQDAQPRGWGNATRLRREVAEATRRAQSAQQLLAAAADQLAVAQARISDLERECEILRGHRRRVPRAAVHHYWDVFQRSCLADQRMPAEYVAAIDQATDWIVEQFDVPDSAEPFQARVKILIPVGAGKTAYATGTVAKAIDSGYRLVLVLSPPFNAFRTQLQSRLSDVLGGPGVLWLTGDHHDYRKVSAGFELLRPSHDIASLLVVKRTATILRRLVKDIADVPGRQELPALILDTDGGDLPEGSVTDRLIEDLLRLLPRAQHVRFADTRPAARRTAHEALISIPA